MVERQRNTHSHIETGEKKSLEDRVDGWICVTIDNVHRSRAGRDLVAMPARHSSMQGLTRQYLKPLCAAAAVHTNILFSNAGYILYFSSINFKVNPETSYSALQ